MGLEPTLWGPSLWRSLHYISFGYPEKPTDQEKQDYKNFFLLIRKTLPCEGCREHYTKYTSECGKFHITDKIVESRDSLSKWLYNLHNYINTKLHKPEYKNYEEVKKEYLAMAGGDRISGDRISNKHKKYKLVKVK